MDILIADQSELSISAMSFILKDIFSGCLIYTCSNWNDVEKKLNLNHSDTQPIKIDLVILDIFILSQNYHQDCEQKKWYELLEGVVRKYKHIPVCIISDSADKPYLQKAFSAGAKGYLLKTESVEKIKKRLLNLHEGKIQYPDQLLQSSDTKKTASTLTLRQQEILKLVAKGYPNKTIAKQLGLTECTVKRHVHNIFKKLDAKNRIDAVNIANLNVMLSEQHRSM